MYCANLLKIVSYDNLGDGVVITKVFYVFLLGGVALFLYF